MSRWPRLRLGELCEVLDSKRKPITKSDRVHGDVPYFGASGVLDFVEDHIFDEKLVLLGEDGAKWGAGDRSAFIIEGKSWVNNHVHVLRPDRNLVLDEWLASYLVSADLSDFITGVTVPKLNQARMRDIEIPLPPLDEQKRIVAKLDAAERKLAELRRAIILENNELLELQSATLESALAAADDSDLLALSQFASVDYGFTDSASSSKSGPKFLRITDIQDGEVNWETVPRCEISEKKLASKRLLPGDLVFARTGATTGKSYLIPEGVPEAVAASYLIRVRANTEVVTPTFLAMYFRSARYWDAIGAGTSGSAQGGFNASKLKQLQIPIPRSLETQTKVWTEVEAIAGLIASKYSNFSRKNHAANELGERILSSAFAGDF